MEGTGVDQHEFRAGQRRDWDEASKGWRAWSEFIDRTTAPVSERLVARARVEPGQRVLDVAAGYGEPSLTAAKIVGPEGEVVATDISAGMLAYGRERAAAAGLQNVEFIESDAVSLDFPLGSFDAALSRWGIIFEPDGGWRRARERSRPTRRRWRNLQVTADLPCQDIADHRVPRDCRALAIRRIAPPGVLCPLADERAAVPFQMGDQVTALQPR